MRHLRYLALFALFGLLPAFVARETVATWLSAARAERIEEFHASAARLLEDARDRILSETTRHEFAEAIVDEIEKRSDFESGAVAEILKTRAEMYPGVLEYQAYLVSVKEGTVPWESARGVPLATNVGGGVFEYRQLADFLIRHRLYLERDRAGERPGEEPAPPAFDPRRGEIVRNRLLGVRRSIAYVAESFREAIDVTREGREGYLYWDFAWSVEEEGRDRVPRAIVLLFIDPEAFRRAHAPERIVERVRDAAGVPGLAMEILVRGGAAPERKDAFARWFAAAGVTSAARVADGEALLSLLRVSEVDGALLAARIDRALLHADLDRLDRLSNSFFAALLALALAATLPVHLRWISPFVSLRHQVAALFLLAALPPLSAIALGGLHALRSSRVALEEEAFLRVRARALEADESARSALAALRRTAQSALEAPETRALASPPAGGDGAEERAAFGRLAANLCLFPEIESCALLDARGTCEVVRGEPGDAVERELVAAYARRILAHLREGMPRAGADGTVEPGDPSRAFAERLAERADARGGDDVVRARGRLHRIPLPGRELCLFLEPILSADGRAERCLAIRFRLPRVFSRVIDRFHAEGERRREEGVRAFCLPPPDLPDARAGNWVARRPEVREFVRRVARGGEGKSARVAVDGIPHLIWGAPLSVIRGAVAFGICPLTSVDEEIARRRGYFLAVSLLTVLAAILGSLLLSRRILSPLSHVEGCVRAIAEGDLDVAMHLESRDEFGELSRTFNRMAEGLREKRRMSRYVSSHVLDEVRKGGDEGVAVEVECTILFTDLRDFTGISERHPPGDVVEMLNGYLSLVTSAVLENGGAVDKFIGDAVMAVFHADPRPGARGHARRAVVCALAVRDALARYNGTRRAAGRFEIDCGIGINTGEVIRGNVGSPEHRVDLTVIGDHVNLAARLEALSRAGSHTRIVLSERTLRGAADIVEAVELSTTRVKGKSREVRLFEVTGLRRARDLAARLALPDPETRIEALRLLAALGDPAAVEPVRALLRDAEPAVRGEAARALAAFGADPGTAALLLERLPAEPDPSARAAFVRAIGISGDDEGRLALAGALADADDRVRANAIEALGAVTDRARVVRALEPYRADRNNRVRGNACVALFAFGERSGLEELVAMAAHGDPFWRATGAWGIGECASRERLAGHLRARGGGSAAALPGELLGLLDAALDRLLSLLDDADAMVFRNAVRSIGRTGHRRAVDPLLAAYRNRAAADARERILGALEEIGSFNIVKNLRDELRR